jgi:hypothetical protein
METRIKHKFLLYDTSQDNNKWNVIPHKNCVLEGEGWDFIN